MVQRSLSIVESVAMKMALFPILLSKLTLFTKTLFLNAIHGGEIILVSKIHIIGSDKPSTSYLIGPIIYSLLALGVSQCEPLLES